MAPGRARVGAHGPPISPVTVASRAASQPVVSQLFPSQLVAEPLLFLNGPARETAHLNKLAVLLRKRAISFRVRCDRVPEIEFE